MLLFLTIVVPPYGREDMYQVPSPHQSWSGLDSFLYRTVKTSVNICPDQQVPREKDSACLSELDHFFCFGLLILYVISNSVPLEIFYMFDEAICVALSSSVCLKT